MSDLKTQPEDTNDPLKIAISAFVSVTHIIAFFQIVICSRHMAVAFNIPAKNIGIYFAKLYSLRSLLMSMGCAVEYVIFRATSSSGVKEVRRYSSIGWFVLLTICEVSFLIVLYSSKNVAYHNYIVLNFEGMFFGFFQMSVLSLIPQFAPYYMVSLYVSGTCIFIIQTIIDRFTKNSMLSVKIQSWICVFCSIESVALWTYYLICLYNNPTNSTQQPSNGHSNGLCRTSRSAGFPDRPFRVMNEVDASKIDFFMSMSSLSILKIIRSELDRLCTCTDNRQQITNIKFLINVLEQIRSEDEICVRLFIRIDFVIVVLKEMCCLEGETTLLEQLVFVLRGKYILALSKCRNELTQVTLAEPEPHIEEESAGGCSGRSRRKREADNSSGSKAFENQLFESLSPMMMFPVGSSIKDFLFPGVLPYALLERDKCHLINLIVIIFLSIGPLTIFLINRYFKEFKCDVEPYHYFWLCMVPKIIILVISLCAIHTKQGCTHNIRSSQGIVLFMTVVLLTCYGFLETMSFVGMGFYVKFISKDPSGTADLQAIHNVFGKFFRYFVYKVSVGYNKTRIGAGFVLPNFKPPEPIPSGFCFWFRGAFSNGGKDIKGDFKMGIKQYLAVSQTISKKSPIDTLRFCDVLM